MAEGGAGCTLHKTLLVIKIITAIVAFILMFINIYEIIRAGDYVFPHWWDAVFWFSLRVYGAIFCLVIAVFELPFQWAPVRKVLSYFMVFKTGLARGLFQFFVGVLTASGALGTTDDTLNTIIILCSVMMMVMGILNATLSWCDEPTSGPSDKEQPMIANEHL
eukprot:NODE_2288_length_605_cov_67.020921_g2238_i0.p1 GENE.NODE_2288_length_605_cov_67.020921_g2238_i0~~NODE_2288_length_605_cov_67.020921_g2238_i0.p1  ORF type:complete len:163 (-),score=13.04 NODE_2288_length_605_cov_67.020921_g2238_i0:61-549(-)